MPRHLGLISYLTIILLLSTIPTLEDLTMCIIFGGTFPKPAQWDFIPLPSITSLINCILKGYHIFNFMIHLLATGLVWALATVLFKIVGDVLLKSSHLLLRCLFLVHPCQTQAVTYISQRFESMATVFYFGSIYSYLCARISSSKGIKSFYLPALSGLLSLAYLPRRWR